MSGLWKRLGVFQILCDWVREGRDIPIIGSGGNRYQLLHVDDLVQITGVVAQAEAALADGTFNVGAAVFGTMREDLQELLDYAAHGGRVRPVPAGLVIPALRALEFLHLSPLYEWVYETADKEHYVSLDKLRQRFNWQPRKGSAAVWIDTYRWYVEEFAGLAVTTGTGHRIAWKQRVLGLVKRFF